MDRIDRTGIKGSTGFQLVGDNLKLAWKPVLMQSPDGEEQVGTGQ